jgi:4-hydroxy-3-polyprenylbenzoate decarboxylase
MTFPTRVSVGITGASGACYALRLLEALVQQEVEISLVISTAGQLVLATETDLKFYKNQQKNQLMLAQHFHAKPNQIKMYSKDQWSAPLASGTGAPKQMVICPCTTGCLSAVAHGSSDNLLERAADVVIKEQGKLILVVREMPFSVIHLQNMLSLAQQGVVIMPANPGFYFNPTSLEEIVDFVVAKILDQLGLPQTLSARWGSED